MSLFLRRRKGKYSLTRKGGEKFARAISKNNISGNGLKGKLYGQLSSLNWGIIRINGIIVLFCLIWIGLWGRAWHLQMVDGPVLADKARRQHVATELVSGKRGNIYDRNGQALAISVEARSVYANPSEVEDIDKTADVLGALLDLDTEKIKSDLARSGRHFMWLKRKIDDNTAAAIKKAHLAGIGLTREYERFYPFKHMAGQLLGFVGMDDKGLEGMERSLEEKLGVMPVRQLVQRDAMGRRFYQHINGHHAPVGEDISLTLDMRFQFIAEEAIARAAREFEARWSGALVIDVSTGDILAWAQYPFFNPNNYRDSSPKIYRNRLASDALEPGSTFKPLVMAAALEEKKLTPNTLINCEGGKWNFGKYTIRDTSVQGILPASKIIRYSSNIGMAKIGQSLGSRLFHKYLSSLGFGEINDIPVANSKGILRKPRDWGEMDVMATAFGQSISVTALQMAQAYLTFLNNGVHKPLNLISKGNEEITTVPATPRKRVFSSKSVSDVMDMMKDVVESSDGTGRRAKINGMEAGGKTGTAQKADRRSRTYGNEHLASFVGFFPARNPQYLILVFVDEPVKNQFGGIVAAPVFKEIASRIIFQAGSLDDKKQLAQKKSSPTQRIRGLKLAKAPKQPWSFPESPTVVVRKSDPMKMELPGHLSKASENVPNVTGKSVRNAVELFARAGIVPEVKGTGNKVIRQSPRPGTPWGNFNKEEICTLWLSEG